MLTAKQVLGNLIKTGISRVHNVKWVTEMISFTINMLIYLEAYTDIQRVD